VWTVAGDGGGEEGGRGTAVVWEGAGYGGDAGVEAARGGGAKAACGGKD
jgi:hypothetical protein